jgi:hypothetical protein
LKGIEDEEIVAGYVLYEYNTVMCHAKATA